MILMIFFRIVDYFLINVCIFLGEGSGQMHTRICIVIMNRSMLNRKLRKKTGVVRFWKSFRSEITLGNSNFLNLSFSVATETEVLIYITRLLKVFSCMFNESNDLKKERVSILESITLDC